MIKKYIIPLIENIAEITLLAICYIFCAIYVVALFATLPLWIIPYMIYKRKKERENK